MDGAEADIAFLIHTFCFLVKIWCLHYPQCNLSGSTQLYTLLDLSRGAVNTMLSESIPSDSFHFQTVVFISSCLELQCSKTCKSCADICLEVELLWTLIQYHLINDIVSLPTVKQYDPPAFCLCLDTWDDDFVKVVCVCVCVCVQKSTLLLDPLYRGGCRAPSDSSPEKQLPAIR